MPVPVLVRPPAPVIPTSRVAGQAGLTWTIEKPPVVESQLPPPPGSSIAVGFEAQLLEALDTLDLDGAAGGAGDTPTVPRHSSLTPKPVAAVQLVPLVVQIPAPPLPFAALPAPVRRRHPNIA